MATPSFAVGTKKGRKEVLDFVTSILAPKTKAAQVKLAKTHPVKTLGLAYGALKTAYYAGTPIVEDDDFDAFESIILAVDKKLYSIGSQSTDLNKVALPFPMASMNKVLTEKGLLNWSAKYKGPYVRSDKLDGISIGIKGTSNPKAPKLYTRGDGTAGLDISHLAPYLNLPAIPSGFEGRGELIMPVADFKAFSKDFANPRNLVAGAANSKIITPAFKGRKIKVVMYQIIKPALKVSAQFKKLKAMGFLLPQWEVVDELDINEMTPHLLSRRKVSKLELDGVIYSQDIVYKSSGNSNPDTSFAFKSALMSEVAKATVVKVHWNASRYGKLKPRVEIEPVKLAGVTVKFATGHTAKYIKENKIGPGAVITIIRSGDVIPYITGVPTPAKKADMPKLGTYEWDDNKVNIISVEDTDQQLAKQITYFFVTLGLEEFKQATFEKVLGAELIDSVQALIRSVVKKPNTFTKALVAQAGFGAPTASKFVKAIRDIVTDVDLASLMVASAAFGHGMGLTLLQPAALSLGDPALLKPTAATKAALSKKLGIEGFGPKRTAQFLTELPTFMTAFKKYVVAGLTYQLPKKPKKVKQASDIFKGERFYLTGVRDDKVTEFITKNGGTIGAFNANLTTTLIYKDGASNSKVDSFTGKKIPYSEFLKTYGIH